MREKRHLSPWREMGYVPGGGSRVRHARDYTLLCCGLGVASWAALALFRGAGIWNPAIPMFSHWWTPVLRALTTLLYGVAAWGIGRRDPRAAILALTLFGLRILGAAVVGRPLSFGVFLSVIGIGLVLRAAQPLGLSFPSRRDGL